MSLFPSSEKGEKLPPRWSTYLSGDGSKRGGQTSQWETLILVCDIYIQEAGPFVTDSGHWRDISCVQACARRCHDVKALVAFNKPDATSIMTHNLLLTSI